MFGEAARLGAAALVRGERRPARGRQAGRDDWSARHWSPIAAAEALVTRERVALYDMTPLTRLEVTGPVSFLQGLTSNDVDRPVGTVVYTLLLDAAGGIRSDVTVARLGRGALPGRRQRPARPGLAAAARAATACTVRDITGGTCGIGVWGPRARDLVAPLTDIDVSHAAFGYFKARRAHLGAVPVTMLRLSYVGELGWELYTSAELGLKLWDTLWAAGRRARRRSPAAGPRSTACGWRRATGSGAPT